MAAQRTFWLALMVVGAALAGYTVRWYVVYQDIRHSEQLIEQFQSEQRQLRSQINNQESKFQTLQAKLASVQSELDAIIPNTYIIKPNESMIVGNGHLTLGLIGSPTNENVNISINGKQQSAVAGDVINIASDASTKCQVKVQSFDMFKALLTASCIVGKPQ